MDSQVDQVQVHEIATQAGERAVGVVDGKSRKLVRTFVSGADEVIDIYEGKDGQLELVKRSIPLGSIEQFPVGDPRRKRAESGGTACGSECLDKIFKDFDALLTKFEAAQKVEPTRLEKIDDFYVSRVGVLIHEECFEKYGKEVERWVTDSIVQGMQCMFNNVNYTATRERRSMGRESHIPRLMSLFNSSQAVKEGAIFDANGSPRIMTNPCQDYKSLPIAKDMKVHQKCSYVPEAKLGAPKLICQVDQFNGAVSIHSANMDLTVSRRNNGYGSGPHNKMPTYVNWKAKTKVYNYPVVAFIGTNHLLDEDLFKSKFWHEVMHNLGYGHLDENVPDRAFFCEVACFGKAYGFIQMEIDGAEAQCESPGNSTSTFSQLEDIKRVIVNF